MTVWRSLIVVLQVDGGKQSYGVGCEKGDDGQFEEEVITK
jgi:hypothetical protein